MGAIGLNPIRLDRIGLDPIRINAIKLGVPGAASDRPYIDPEVLASLKAVCICYGKSNDDPDRAVVKNLVDPSNPFIISNAAYTEGSGYADKGSPYYGAFVTDGINDLITSTKTVQEMLGGSNEITVVSLITHISGTGKYNIIGDGGIQVSDYSGQTLMAGTSSSGEKIVELGDKEKLQAVQYTTFDSKLAIGLEDSSYAYYGTFVFNKENVPVDWIHQVIAYFNLDRTLKPDILCNTIKQGITNENHAEFGDKLIDFSGNGRDIQLNNIAWDGDSGIGKYNYPNWKVTATIANTYSTIVNYPTVNGTYSINVNGVSELMQSIGLHLEIKYTTSTGIIYNDIKQDGVYSYILPDGATDLTLRFGGIPGIVNEPCNITITQIPSHAGALCLDGVNDFGQFVGDLELKDYTFIADRAYSRIAPSQVPFIASTQTNGQAPFLMEYLNEDTYVYPHSFGTTTKTTNLNIQRQISYQSTYVYNGNSISKGTSVDTGDGLTIGNSGSTGLQYSPLCLWSLMLFPYSMSEFLIERQLKKHKLGTLYPDMVEFRPIVKSNVKWDIIEIWQGNKSLYRPAVNDDKTGIYLKKDSTIGIYVKPYVGQKVSEIVYNGVSYTDLKLNSNGFYYKVVPITKSPQKITMTIEQDENYVKFEPVITSNVEYVRLDFYLNNYQKRINIGDYIPKDAYLRANLYLKNNVDELTVFTFNGINIDYKRSVVDDTAFNIGAIYNYDSPQEVNITVDEYIRYEDIVQPYPSFVKLENLDRTYTYTWGDKLKVGDTIRYNSSVNLLEGVYTLKGQLECNGVYVYDNNQYITVAKEMIFAWTNSPIWSIDDNEPKCILSPRLLRIPNSSYKILGYIPDISGHGNHGKINNSAYAEGSGVNEDGSYQFDGVDDFVTIPTLSSGGKQMLMKVNWNSLNHVLYDQRNNAEAPFCIVTASRSIAYNQGNVGGNTYIDGILNNHILVDDLQAITHNIVLNNDYNVANSNSFIGTNYTKSIYAKMSLYDFMLFDEISTDDKIKELNKYVGIEGNVWGILTQLSNSTLISNETLIKNE